MPTLFRIWDLPTRIFHWVLAGCVAGLLVTGQLGYMEWHFRLGYAVWTLLLFRLAWGVIGGRWSRFLSFCYAPATIVGYLRGAKENPLHEVGHTPPGSLSVFAMLGVLAVQVATGLFSDDEIASSGPFARLVSSDFVETATWYHHSVGEPVLIGLLLLHIGAILYYWLRRGRNLVAPMITGDKALASPAEPSRDDRVSRWLAVLVVLLCAGLVALALTLAAAT